MATLVQHKKIMFPSVLNFKNVGTVLTAKVNFAQTSAKKLLGHFGPLIVHLQIGFKQVQIAYLAVINNLDKFVQFSYTLSKQIRLLASPRAC